MTRLSLDFSVSVVIPRNGQRTAIGSGECDAPVTGVCDQVRLAGASAADSELAARPCLSIQLARWGLLSTVSEVTA